MSAMVQALVRHAANGSDVVLHFCSGADTQALIATLCIPARASEGRFRLGCVARQAKPRSPAPHERAATSSLHRVAYRAKHAPLTGKSSNSGGARGRASGCPAAIGGHQGGPELGSTGWQPPRRTHRRLCVARRKRMRTAMRKVRPLDARRSSASVVHDRGLQSRRAVVKLRLRPSVLPAPPPLRLEPARSHRYCPHSAA